MKKIILLIFCVLFFKLSYSISPDESNNALLLNTYNVDKIQTVIYQRRVELQKRVKNHFLKIVLILAAILFFVLMAAKIVSNRTKKSFDLFATFFSQAATQSAKIDSENLPFVEFESLARAANRMVEQRNQAEIALRGGGLSAEP